MKKKILSLLTAFAMVFGIIAAPFTSASAADETELPGQATTSTEDGAETNSVTVHKILMSQKGLKNHNADKQYAGGELTIADFFEANAKDIGGVYFVWKTKDGQYIKAKDASTEAGKLAPSITEGKVDTTTNIDEAMGGLTVDDKGIKFTTTGMSGEYQIDEIHDKSTYTREVYFDAEGNELVKRQDGKYFKKTDTAQANEVLEKDVIKKGTTLTDMKAVPVLLTLPLRNDKGTVLDAHVYPKNIEEKPQIDKNFKQGNNLTKIEDPEKNLGAGAVYENYTKEKALASQELDKNVPYEIKTEIPAKAKYAQAYWDDVMTKGLTYNKDLVITINGEPAVKGVDYNETEKENGFKAEFTDEGLKKINNQAEAVTVMLTYSAKINKNAVIDIPESNNVRFFYGNNKGKGNTPIPTNPKNGDLTVKKTWDNGSAWADGESATFKLVDANTGEDVTATDLVNAPDDYTFEGTVTLKKGVNETYTWKYLNDKKQYKAVEISSTTLSDAEYSIDENGNIVVTNHKSNNPAPLEPTTPKVETYGKKFVKVDEEGNRLKDAKFAIKNAEGKFLKEKDATAIKTAQDAVALAKQELDQAIAAYNNLSADDQKGDKGTAAKATIKEKQDALDKAVIAANEFYQWVDADDVKKENKQGVKIFNSNEAGQFEVTRLNKGKYTLVEVKAPEGFADRADIDFEVGPDTYSNGDIKYDEKESKAKDALKVINRKVIIPQTGGIGSLIFIVAGIGIMTAAFVAYKRSQATA